MQTNHLGGKGQANLNCGSIRLPTLTSFLFFAVWGVSLPVQLFSRKFRKLRKIRYVSGTRQVCESYDYSQSIAHNDRDFLAFDLLLIR